MQPLTPSRIHPVQRIPLVPVVAAMAAGIAAGRYLPLPTAFWALPAVAGMVAAVLAGLRKHLHAIAAGAVLATIVSLGALHARLAHFTVPDDHVVNWTDRQPILATLRARIVTSPVRTGQAPLFGYHRQEGTGFIAEAKGLRVGDGWRPVSGLVRVGVDEPAEHLAAGQDVELVGRLERFRPPSNPGEFDQAAAARRNHTLVRMSVPAADGVIVQGGPTQPWYVRLYWHVRASVRQHLLDVGDTDAHLVSAMVIGERDPALMRLNDAMIRLGISHFLSISGLHLGVFLGFVYLICRLAALSPSRSAWIVLAVLAAYMLLAEPSAPLLRSAIMAACLCAATIRRRNYGSLNALAGAAILLLALDPLQLFSPGFQLSFATVGGIVVFRRPLRGKLFGRWIRRRGLVVFRSEQRFRRYLHFTLSNWLIDAAVISLAAYLTSAPLVACHFGLFSPYASPLSVLLSPLVTAVLVPGYLSIALLWPLPGLSWAVGRAAAGAADAVVRAVDAMAVLPGSVLELYPLPAGWVALCYAAVALVVLGRRAPLGRLAGGVAAAGFVVWTVLLQLPASPPDVAELHLLSVGSGQCALLRTPSGRTVLLDAGTTRSYDAYEQVIRPFLLHERLPRPRGAFVSHANADHYNALPGLIQDGTLERLWLNPYFGRGLSGPSADESTEARLIRLAEREGVEIVRLDAGDSIRLDDRTSVEVLWPPEELRPDLSANDTSLALRIRCDDKSVLLAGDVDETGQRGLLASPAALKADALILPHHGGWEPALPEFLDAVSPAVTLVSCARDPQTVQGAGDLRARFYQRIRSTTRYHSTARNGWIRLRFGRGELAVQTMR